MSAWDFAKSGLKMMNNVIHGLEVIQSFTKLGGTQADHALKAIDAVIKSLMDGFSGKASPEAVHMEIEALQDQVRDRDERMDEKLRHKFDHGKIEGE